jgi:hypothetical protein
MLIKVLKKDCGRSECAVNKFKWQKCVGNTVSGRCRTYLIKLYGIHDNATDNIVLTTVQVVHRKNTVQKAITASPLKLQMSSKSTILSLISKRKNLK